MSGEPALRDLNRIDDRAGGAGDWSLIEGLHVVDLKDPARGADVGDGEGGGCVLHPEGDLAGAWKDKDHSLVGAQIGAGHKAHLAGGVIGSDLSGERVRAEGEGGLGEVGLRLRCGLDRQCRKA